MYADQAVYFDTFASPVGELLVVVAGDGLRTVAMQDGPSPVPIDPRWRRSAEATAHAREQIAQYFAGSRRRFDLQLSPVGTTFARSVWDELDRLPYGATVTYSELAARVGRPGAARAVGRANATNPRMIVAPCHRVVGADGALTGFAGGIEAKRTLLELEAAAAA